jgi:antitoxin PrlF
MRRCGMLSTVTSKGQVTIPKRFRQTLGIKSSDMVDFEIDGQKLILMPVKTLMDFRGAVKKKSTGDFEEERRKAKTAVAKRVKGEME